MDIHTLFEKNTCDIRGKTGSDTRTWEEFFANKEMLNKQWIEVVLVDMIQYPVHNAVPISNELFMSNTYPHGTYFVLYCHSGWSSGYVQQQLKKAFPYYNTINMDWGITAYHIYAMNH